MSGYALLFPGQGTQHPQMLPWLDHEPLAQPLLQTLAALIGADWRTHLQDDPAWRSRNAVAQVLLTGVSLAAWAPLAQALPPPTIVAGYSVGELAACAAAGLYDSNDALPLAAQRAALMDAAGAAAGGAGGMLSVSGLPLDSARARQATHGLHTAITLAADKAVLAGPIQALDTASVALQALGAEVKRLDVHIASHTPWMAPAAAGFAAVLQGLPLHTPRAWAACNADGRALRQAPALAHALSQQIAQTVQWPTCQQSIAERRVRCVLEVGPGHTLAKLWQAAWPDIPVRSLEDFAHWQAAAAWVRGHLDLG